MKYLVLLMGYGDMPSWEDLSEEEQAAAAEAEAGSGAAAEDDGGSDPGFRYLLMPHRLQPDRSTSTKLFHIMDNAGHIIMTIHRGSHKQGKPA